MVIGILIALQLNNWNVKQKSESLKIELLTNLKSELQNDLMRLDITDQFLEDRKRYSSQLLEYFEEIPKKIDSVQVILAIERCGYAHTFNPSMPTYNEMKGSGNLNLIQSNSLTRALVNYETFIYNSLSIEERYANTMTDFSNTAMKYMDPQFGFIDIKDTIAQEYQGLNFDLKAMAVDDELVTLTKIVLNRTIVEKRYKEDLIKPRIINAIELIDIELNDSIK